VRDMHRATVSDIANTCEQEGIRPPMLGDSSDLRPNVVN
jgi:hypothetical protein